MPSALGSSLTSGSSLASPPKATSSSSAMLTEATPSLLMTPGNNTSSLWTTSASHHSARTTASASCLAASSCPSPAQVQRPPPVDRHRRTRLDGLVPAREGRLHFLHSQVCCLSFQAADLSGQQQAESAGRQTRSLHSGQIKTRSRRTRSRSRRPS